MIVVDEQCDVAGHERGDHSAHTKGGHLKASRQVSLGCSESGAGDSTPSGEDAAGSERRAELGDDKSCSGAPREPETQDSLIGRRILEPA